MRIAVLAAALALLLHARPADACGGFFCNATQPVIQSGERIMFAVDPDASSVEAIIEIAYQGDAAQFAWILPLAAEPTRIAVGSSFAFGVADRLTAPRFVPRVEMDGTCRSQGIDAGAAAFSDAGAASDGGGGGVTVLRMESVGPYQTVVLMGTDGPAVRRWLEMNGYFVTDAMIAAVVPYISQGFKLLALKLEKNNNVGDLQPIALTIPTREACIPIRLTAIAALSDMEVTALVLSNKGRTVPTNYRHIVPNFARVNWLQRGSNYRQLISAAADEGGGNAFTTEYYGRTTMFAQQIHVEGRYDLAGIRAARTLDAFLSQVQNQGLTQRPEIRGILRRHVDMTLTSLGLDPVSFWGCTSCYWARIMGQAFDPAMAAAEIDERIVTPDREAQALFDRYQDLTRLYTLISPEEMNVDPLFAFDRNAPEVSNVHGARVIMRCGADGIPGSDGVVVILDEDNTTFAVDTSGNLSSALAGSLPAALRVEQYPGPVLVKDNAPDVRQRLEEDPMLERTRAGCGCQTTPGGGTSLALAALAALTAIGRRRSSRR